MSELLRETFSGATAPNALNMSMDAQKRRYGERLYDKNPATGKYRCFFCNKELRANFSRHISRHEIDGDQVNEEIKHAILNGLPLPPPSTNTAYESKLSRDSSGSLSVQVKRKDHLASSQRSSTSNVVNLRRQLEQQFFQLLMFLIRKLPQTELYAPLTQKFIALAEEQIVSSNNVTLTAFYNTISHIGKQLVITRGNNLEELELMERITKILLEAHKLELCKVQLQKEKFGQKCALCQDDASNSPLVTCNGECVRSFHAKCAILNDEIKVTQISTLSSGYAAICSDCESNRKVLRWDPFLKQHFYLDFINDATVSVQESNIPILVDEESQSKGISVHKGIAKDISLDFVSAPEIESFKANVPISVPNYVKKELRKDDAEREDDMWYDPFWCIWRYKTKEGARDRNKRQHEHITKFEFSDDSTDTEEPPQKIQKLS